MVDQTVFSSNSQVPQGQPDPSDFVRQTEHRAITQPAQTSYPQVSYEAEDYQVGGPNQHTFSQIQQVQPPLPPADSVTAAPLSEQPFTPQTPPQAPQPTTTVQPPPTPVVPTSSTTTQEPNSTQPPLPDDVAEHFADLPKPKPERTFLEWESPSRPFKKRSRQYYSTGVVIVLLISMILFFAQQVIPIAVVVAVAFLGYVLSVVPPTTAHHQLTTYGIRIDDQLYYWDELGRFWFTDKYGQRILHIEVARFPWRLSLLLGDLQEEYLSNILSEVLIKQQPALTPFEKASEWLQNKIPLENE